MPAVKPPRAVGDALYDELKAQLSIDRNRLDEAVEQQATVFAKICEEHVLVSSQRDEAHDVLARRDAEIAREFRANPKEGQKITEAITNDAVMLHPEHVRLSQTLNQLKARADRWWGLRQAFDQRVRMLHELVSLYSGGYFTSSGAQGSKSAVSDALAATARARMDEKRKERLQS